jgi:geranylgeranylglycerol-phosphate geranylgeranyltransferase
MNKLKAIWQLLRLEHGLMYGVGVIIGIVVTVRLDFQPENLILGFLTAMFIQGAAFALNDYYDYDVDLKNKRTDRPLVRGELSRRSALLLFLILTPAGLASALLISIQAFILTAFITFLGFAYDIKLKEFGIVGNAYIAFSMAAPFIFGSVVASNTIEPPVAILASIAFLSGFGREIMKGIEDVEGDALRDVKTVARVKGSKTAADFSAIIYIFSVLLSPIPFIAIEEFAYDFKYLLPVLITDFILLKISLELIQGKFNKENIRKFRKHSLIAMMFGLAGFLFGAF